MSCKQAGRRAHAGGHARQAAARLAEAGTTVLCCLCSAADLSPRFPAGGPGWSGPRNAELAGSGTASRRSRRQGRWDPAGIDGIRHGDLSPAQEARCSGTANQQRQRPGARRRSRQSYYRAHYGGYEPDWIMQPDGVLHQAAWDRYLTKPARAVTSTKAAYTENAPGGRRGGIPGPRPGPELHGGPRIREEPRDRARRRRQSGYEPEDAGSRGGRRAVRDAPGRARERGGEPADRQAEHDLEAGS